MNLYTTAEVAQMFKCDKQKILDTTRTLNLGVVNIGGRAGYRYTDADIEALRESFRPVQAVAPRRRRRSA